MSDERSQYHNKAIAMKRLIYKLSLIAEEQKVASIKEVRGNHVDATFGQQIRNYILAPYKLVKDCRSGYETSRVDDVLDGKLDDFIYSYLRFSSSSKDQ